MTLSPMRFKDYVWPHNPRVYEIGFRRDIRAHRVPFGSYVLQDMGRQHRVLRGEGEFTGPGAYQEFRKLAKVFYDGGAGMLSHPLWDTAQAQFVALSLRQEPTENYVAYAFEFWECGEGYTAALTSTARRTGTGASAAAEKSGAAAYYTVQRGDCMWNIARAQGITLAELTALNPQVKNPNLIHPGEVLRVK